MPELVKTHKFPGFTLEVCGCDRECYVYIITYVGKQSARKQKKQMAANLTFTDATDHHFLITSDGRFTTINNTVKPDENNIQNENAWIDLFVAIEETGLKFAGRDWFDAGSEGRENWNTYEDGEGAIFAAIAIYAIENAREIITQETA